MPDPRGTYFGRRAAEYDRLRPSPTADALDWVLPCGADTVVDLAAGTGLVTRALADRARRVVAVEPDARMLAWLVDSGARAAPVRGNAEGIPLRDGTADAVLVASAWHWFDPQRATAEIARVLRPGGVLALLWSRADPSVWWVEQARAIGRAAMDGSADLARRGFDVELPPGSPFGPGERRAFHRTRAMSRDDVAAMVTTYSGVLALPDAEREDVARRAREFLDEALPDGGDPLEVPFETACWRAVRAGSAPAARDLAR